MNDLPNGLLVPVATPFKNDSVDVNGLVRNLDMLNKTDLTGYLVLGSTSETPLLNREERLLIVREAANVIQSSAKSLFVGVMEESTICAIEFVEQTSRYNPDAYLVLPPTYYKPRISKAVLMRFYAKIADAAPTPVLLYNVPMFSAVETHTETLLALEKKGVISGWKDSSTDINRFREVCNATSGKFSSYIGNAGLLVEGLKYGASGGILAAANAIPDLCCEVYKAFINDDAGLKTLQKSLDEFLENVLIPFGIPGIKAAMDYSGYCGGEVRKPYPNLRESDREKVINFLANRLHLDTVVA